MQVIETLEAIGAWPPRFDSFSAPAPNALTLRRNEVGHLGTENFIASFLNPRVLPANGPGCLVMGDVHHNWTPVHKVVDMLEAQGSLAKEIRTIVLGDLFEPPELRFPRPVYYVQGNLDRYNLFEKRADELARDYNLHRLNTLSELNGVQALVVHGVPPRGSSFPFPAGHLNNAVDYAKKGETSLAELRSLQNLSDSGVQCPIILTHCPPLIEKPGIHAKVSGARFVSDAVNRFQAKVLFAGHLHRDWFSEIDNGVGKCAAVGVNYAALSMAFLDLSTLHITKLYSQALRLSNDGQVTVTIPELRFEALASPPPHVRSQEAATLIFEFALSYLAEAGRVAADPDRSWDPLWRDVQRVKMHVQYLAPDCLKDLQLSLHDIFATEWFSMIYGATRQSLMSLGGMPTAVFSTIAGRTPGEYAEIIQGWLDS